MRKVFWDDPYQTNLTTTVERVEGNQILLAETIAFSFSGGQESDKATINELEVLGSLRCCSHCCSVRLLIPKNAANCA